MLCFFHSLWLRRLAKSAPKNGSCGGSAAQDVDKICTTLWRENELEVKIVKNGRSRGVFGGFTRFSRGRRNDFDTLQNAWQAQEYLRVAQTLAGAVGLKRVRNDAFRVAGAS